METDGSREMANDHIPERKASYRKAIGAVNKTESQTKAAHFQNATITSTSSDDPVVEFSTGDGLSSFGSGKKGLKSIFFLNKSLYLLYIPFRTSLANQTESVDNP